MFLQKPELPCQNSAAHLIAEDFLILKFFPDFISDQFFEAGIVLDILKYGLGKH